jgi:hypothetical protein
MYKDSFLASKCLEVSLPTIKVLGAGEDVKDNVTGHDEDRYTNEAGQKGDPLTSYRDYQ